GVARVVRQRQILDGPAAGEYRGDLVTGGVHHIPELVVFVASWIATVLWIGLEPNNRARHAVAIGCSQCDAVLRIWRALVADHLADAAQRHDDPFVVEILELIELVDVWDLFEELSLRIHAELADAAGGDLDVEVPLRAIVPDMDALDEERRDGEFLGQTEILERAGRDPKGEVRAQMRHQVPADQLFLRNGVEGHARALDGPHAENDGAAGRHVDPALVCLDPNDAATAADEPGYINVVDDHQTLLCVRDAEIERSGLLRL